MISINILFTCCIGTALIASTAAQTPTDVKGLSPDQIAAIAQADNHTHFTTVLGQIIQPRVPGTPSHEEVKNYIINELRASDFDVELDSFLEQVPILGNITFTNVVGRLNPNANRFLALACHYDSKYFPGETFYGATDSAVPCAIMLNLVKTLKPVLDQTKAKNNISLMLVFFDGEEAFKEWSQEDSLYGSRHLASKWALTRTSEPNSRLVDDIEAFVLLDLLGGPNPKFYNFYDNTADLHLRLIQIERHLHDNKLISGNSYMFKQQYSWGGVDDDHRPFLEKNVPILHVIPSPFPKVWHKIDDNLENLSFPSIKRINKILRVFVADYFATHKPNRSFRE